MKLTQSPQLHSAPLFQVRTWLILIGLGLSGALYSQSLDAFRAAMSGPVYATAVQTDGKILAGQYLPNTDGSPKVYAGRFTVGGSLDPTFNPVTIGLGYDFVGTVVVQPDGKIVLGGGFFLVADGQYRDWIVRLNADSTLDTSFLDPGVGGAVNSVAIQDDGRLVIGGSFNYVQWKSHSYLARLNADGTPDTTFALQPDKVVNCVVIQPDNKILVGGEFNNLGTQLSVGVARLNPDGTVDASFQASTNLKMYSVACLGLQADGKILVGGAFDALAGTSRTNIARLNPNGSIDPTFNPGADGWVYSLIAQTDGKILVGGTFTRLGGALRSHIGRLYPDGTLDPTFDPGADSQVFSITLQSDGKVLVGGGFTNLSGSPSPFLGRVVNTDPATQSLSCADASITWLRGGTSPEVWRTTFEVATNADNWIALGPGTRVPGGWQLTNVVLPPNSTVRARGFVTGGYQNASGWTTEASLGPILVYTQPTSRTNNAGTAVAFATAAAGTPPLTYQWLKDGLNLDDGSNVFGAYSPTLVLSNVSAIDRGGYSVIISNAGCCVTSQVATLSVIDPFINGQPISQTANAGQTVVFKIDAAGAAPLTYQWWRNGVSLDDVGNVAGSQTSTLNLSNVSGADRGTYWVVLTNSFGSLTSVTASLTVADPFLTSQPVSVVTNAGQTASFHVGVGGTAPLSLQWRKYGADVPGATDATLTLTNVQWADTGSYQLLVTNAFGLVTSTGVSLAFPALPDALNPGVSNTVYCLAVQPDGKILVGGAFANVAGQARANLARLNTDGTLDFDFDPRAVGSVVSSLAAQPDGRMLVAGGFTSLGGQPRANLGRLNTDGSLDTGFTPAVNGAVCSLAVQSDGKMLAGGAFSSLGGQARANLGRLNADGTLDTNFTATANGGVYCVAVQADGKILVGGSFTQLAGQARSYIGRFNADGTLDSSFNPGAASKVYSFALLPDGRIVVGGDFTTLAGQSCYRIGRLNADGSLDRAFNPNPNATVYALAALANGQVVAAGAFTSVGFTTRSYVARFTPDGTLDPTFNPGANGTIYGLTVQADGNVLVGGNFTTLAGQPRSRIGRLSSSELATQSLTLDGSHVTWARGGAGPEISRADFEACTNGTDWQTLGPATRLSGTWRFDGVSLPTNAVVRAQGLVTAGYQNGSSWCVAAGAGPLSISIQPVSRTNAAWTVATFTALGVGSPPISYQWCKDGVPLSDGDNVSGAQGSTIILGQVVGADTAGYTAIISNSFGAVTSRVAFLSVVEPVITAQPTSVLTNAGKTVVLSTSVVGTTPFSFQWRRDGVNLSGATNSSLTLTNLQWADAGVYDMIATNTFGGITSACAIVGFASSADAFNPGASGGSVTLYGVYALAVQPDNRVLAAGNFTTLGGQSRGYIGRLNADGTLDRNFNPGGTDWTFALAVQPDGRVLVGGWYTNIGGLSRSYLARLGIDGIVEPDFNPAPTAAASNPGVYALALQPDGKIIVGGGVGSLAGQACANIGRLNPNGSRDTTFGASADEVVYSLALQPDGKILMGGYFTNVCGQARSHIARLNPDGSLDQAFDPRANDIALALAVQPDGKVVAGGPFTSMGGQTRNRIARLNPDGSLDPSFTNSANGNVRCLALQADGRILLGGDFTTLGSQSRSRIGRLNPDGSTDLLFDPGASSTVYAIVLQPDGAILVGGAFSTLAGRSRAEIGRLSNNYPASLSLTLDGSTLTWLRGASSPEVYRVDFDASTNGADWFSLGPATRVTGGWQTANASLPADATVRARGWIASGRYNASIWFADTSIGPPAVSLQPASCTTPISTNASFRVLAEGTPNLGYQWLKNGFALTDGGAVSGCLTPMLTLSNISHADAGIYSVAIANALGTVTSQPAMLNVGDPLIVAQPASISTNITWTVILRVTAIGTAPLRYQWRKNGSPMAGATASTL